MWVMLLLCFFILLLFTVGIVLFQLTGFEIPGPKVIFNTLARDIRAGFRFMKVQIFIRKCHARNLSVCDLFRNTVKKDQNKTCFICGDVKWTYQQVEDYSNQVANAFLAAGYQKGDEVALFMENRVEYVCIWLGLAKIGVVSALINTNQRQQSLAHSINVISAKSVIFSAELASAFKEAASLLERKDYIDYYCLDKIDPNFNSILVKSFQSLLQNASKYLPETRVKKVNFDDKLFYIYTSGTTGLPKAAIIKHSRFLWICAGSNYLMLLRDNDVFYNPLPLYHTAGGILFTSVVLVFGGTMIIRKKFSATNFWKDCIKYNVTVSQYIGEICRYLLNQPKLPEDSSHVVRLMCGNGLKPQIWREFQERFKIKEIVELYGSTEGNTNVVNVFGKVGAVGFVSRIFSRLHPVKLIKVHPETGVAIRDANGLCVRCKPGEAGEIVGKIILNNPINDFQGYASEKATKKKIVKDCFQKGDMAFLSGDILVMDDYGYLYFQDRTGDTFRWRGENVSTCEVESVISKVLGFVTCVVYGVDVPGSEGKAGMAAIQSDGDIVDISTLYEGLSSALPPYAVPRFIRISKNIEMTGTYKLKKVDLQKEGYNLQLVSEPLFVLNLKKLKYDRLDEETYNEILSGKSRL